MRAERLAEAVKSLRGKDRDIHALVVLRHCKAVVELYAEYVTRDHNHALYSVTKSVLATLVGALLRSGRLSSLDLPVADIVAASAALDADKLEKARRIRIRDVMSMASGSSTAAIRRAIRSMVPPIASSLPWLRRSFTSPGSGSTTATATPRLPVQS